MNYVLLIKTAIGAVKTVEALFPANAPGKDKADAAIAIIEELFGEVSGILPALTLLFTTTVNGLRALGVFKTPAPA